MGLAGISKPLPTSYRGLWSAVTSPSQVRGGAPTIQRFSTVFSTPDGLYWITIGKIIIQFNIESLINCVCAFW